jgi:hypothetical protein
MKNQIQMSKDVTLAYCEICENMTPLTEVIHVDLLNDESWTEPECKYCFDSNLDWEERYG